MTQSTAPLSTTTLYLYDLADHLIAELDTAGNTKREYFWLDDQPVAVLDVTSGGGANIYYVHTDHLSRPILMTDAAQTWAWYATFKPFGEVASLTANPAVMNLRFPGQWFQMETGLAYNWHRHYDPTTGRYLQADPLGLDALLSDGPSSYGYVGGSPLVKIDPSGTSFLPDPDPQLSVCLLFPLSCLKSYSNQPPDGGGGGGFCQRPYDPDPEGKCAKAKGEAAGAYRALVNKRIPQYLNSPTPDKNHYESIKQRQSALQDAIRRVRLYCVPLPPELAEWERVANMPVPQRH